MDYVERRQEQDEVQKSFVVLNVMSLEVFAALRERRVVSISEISEA